MEKIGVTKKGNRFFDISTKKFVTLKTFNIRDRVLVDGKEEGMITSIIYKSNQAYVSYTKSKALSLVTLDRLELMEIKFKVGGFVKIENVDHIGRIERLYHDEQFNIDMAEILMADGSIDYYATSMITAIRGYGVDVPVKSLTLSEKYEIFKLKMEGDTGEDKI